MHSSRQRWREAFFLAVGVVLGAVAVSICWATFGPPGKAVIPASAGSPPAVTAPASFATVASGKKSPPRHRSKSGEPGASDWERVAAEYGAQSADFSLARSLLYRLDSRGLRKLAANVATWPHDRRTTRTIREIFHHWAEVDPMAAFAQAQTLPGSLADTALYEAMRAFADAQPTQAAAYFAAPPASDDRGYLHNLSWRRSMLNASLEAWSEQDGQAAANFLGQLPTGAALLYPGYAYRMAAEWATQDPAAAMNWAARLGDQVPRSSALGGVLATWAETDPQAAANYVSGLSGDPNQGSIAETFVAEWAARDLPGAARWVAEQNAAVQAKAAVSVAGRWADSDPAGAAVWAGQLSGDARDAAYGSVADHWRDVDPAGARQWLDGLPASDARDAAIDGYLSGYRNGDSPTEKITWAEKIGDAQKRDSAIIGILNEWLSDTPQAARQWINQVDLPTSVTSKLKGK